MNSKLKKAVIAVATLGLGAVLLNKTSAGRSVKANVTKTVKNVKFFK